MMNLFNNYKEQKKMIEDVGIPLFNDDCNIMFESMIAHLIQAKNKNTKKH